MNIPNPKDPKDRENAIEQAFLSLSQGREGGSAEMEQLQALISELADKDPAAIARLIREWLGEEDG